MADSTFDANLDALVRGESVSSDDELTRFVSDVYGEERNVTMPNALKLRIANDLGLDVTDSPTRFPAPVSRRTLRETAETRRSSRPWAIALAVAAAILVALTGILRWGMPTGNEEQDNRFLFATPAAPTVAATPGVSPEANEWLMPVEDADCPEEALIDRAEWVQLQNERAASFNPDETRTDEPFSPANSEDAEIVVERQRQAMACQNRGDNPEERASEGLPIESPARAWEWQADPATFQAIQQDRIERSKVFSSWVEEVMGLTPDDLIYPTEAESGPVWLPTQAVEMGDGRIALIPGWLATSDETPDSFTLFAPVWIEVDGERLFDEELFFCIGDCDDYWSQLEGQISTLATPVASPESSPIADQSWMQPITPEECVTDESGELPDGEPEDFDALSDRDYTLVGPADPADAFAANDVARQYLACSYPTTLLSDRAATEYALSTEEFSPFTVVTLERQLADGISVSAQLEELGVAPADTVMHTDIESTGFFPPNPEMAFVMDDGRILLMTMAGSGLTNNTDPAFGTILVLVLEDGEWKVDDQVPVCIGDCDATLSQIETLYTDALWLYPISAEECDRNAYLPNDLTAQQSAAIRGRQYQACAMNGEAEKLQGPNYRQTEGEEAQSISEEINDIYSQSGETPGNLQRVARQEMWGADTLLPNDPWTAYQPGSVLTLEDGRIAVLETTAISNQTDNRVSIRTSPVVTTALIWDVEGDSWLLDEQVTVCLGDCDAFWGVDSTPSTSITATPEAVGITIPEACEANDAFRADFTSHDRLPIQLRPEPINQAGVYVEVLSPRTPFQYLCESMETSNPAQDQMDEGQQWLKIRTEDGTEGWIREVDVRQIEP